jgi:hypothetical protein
VKQWSVWVQSTHWHREGTEEMHEGAAHRECTEALHSRVVVGRGGGGH